ncbi:hypothetical protein BCEN4_100013 [Burkholderia cenocepacia]|nr:hypothetical protein BCEN4_100013 [Burkholderia cenocepacia]
MFSRARWAAAKGVIHARRFQRSSDRAAELDSIDGDIPDSDDLCDDAPTRDTKEVERCVRCGGRRSKATGSNI